MKPRGKRILTALMMAGALMGLLAIVFLPGRWNNGAEAHITSGVEIIDTAELCTAAEHGLDDSGLSDCTDAGPNGIPDTLNAIDDGMPSHYQIDTDADTVNDTIVVNAGTDVQVVAHVHDGTADDANGTAVTFRATAASNAFFTSWSREATNDLDGDNNGTPNEATDGVLFTTDPDAQVVQAETVGDSVGVDVDGDSCDATTDTCIDDAGIDTADGFAMAVVNSATPTTSTITVESAVGSDTVDIIWTGPATSVSVESLDNTKLVAQSIIAEADVAGVEKPGLNGDPDLTIEVTIRDTAGNLVPTDANVDCAILTASEQPRADVLEPTDDDGVIDPGPNIEANLADVRPGVKQISLESDVGNTRGDVTVTCWSDLVTNNDVLEVGEPSGTVTVHVSDVPATVVLAGDTTMGVGGSQVLKGTVTDADGQPVADDTNCTFSIIDPGLIGGLVPVNGATTTTDGSTTAILAVGGEGSLFVNLACGTATDILSVTVTGVAPTDTPVPPATDTPVPPATVTPGGVTLTPTPTTPAVVTDTPTPTTTVTPDGTPPTPTVPAATATLAPPPCLVGDANGDGVVDAIDAALILQLDAGLISELPAGAICP